MNITIRLSSVMLALAMFVLALISYNTFASAQTGAEQESAGNPARTNPDGNLDYVVPGGPGFVSVNGATFSPMQTDYEWNVLVGELCNPSVTVGGYYIAPINLPHGATVT